MLLNFLCLKKREDVGRYERLREFPVRPYQKEKNGVVVGNEPKKSQKPRVSLKTCIVIFVSICLIVGFVTMASLFAVKLNNNYGNNVVLEDQKRIIELNQSLQLQTSRLKNIIESPHLWSTNGRSIYISFLSRLTWTQSQAWCSGIGGKLAEIETEKENDFIVNNSLSEATTVGDGVWVGGTNKETEGLWKWASTNTNITFFNWKENEPNNYLEQENCLELAGMEGWLWNDNYCEHSLRFLCEFVKGN
ncbi:C-type lectin lectoxin-Phi1-like [Saccostrea cucullata]|uniref:C-type lectin lectoxin-Phi1-like n=1 Tax=Saccostrea cuccullata TaxID=36930 RepID=UPI002ED6B27F